MTVALDQQTPFGHVNGTSLVFTFSPNPAAKSTVIAAFWSYQTVAPTVADNGSTPNTYSADDKYIPTDGVYIYRSNNILLPSSGNLAVTVSWTGTQYVAGSAHSWTGLQVGAPESHADNNVTGSAAWTSITSGSTGLSSGALYIGVYCSEGGSATLDTTTTAPFTQLVYETSGSWMAGATSYWIGGAAPTTVTWNQTAGQHARDVNTLAAYKAAIQPYPPRVGQQAINRASTF